MKTQGLAVNLITRKPVKWPKYGYRTGTDHATFEVVWKAQHFTLASGAEHRRKGVPSGKALIRDKWYREQIVPMSEVAFGNRI